jgi:hypothetical protein
MEIISVLFIVVSGVALSLVYGRLVLGWSYDVVVATTSFVTFGVGVMALMGFSKFGINGIILTSVTSIVLPFVFVKFYAINIASDNKKLLLLGCIYWMVLFILFTTSGLKSVDISVHIDDIYLLKNNINNFMNTFIFTFFLSLVAGGLSMFMMIHECKCIRSCSIE